MKWFVAGRSMVGRDSVEPSNAWAPRSVHELPTLIPKTPVSCALPMLLLCTMAISASAEPVVVGSKKFTESYVLGEIAKRTLTEAAIPAEHRQGMGGTIILWEALRGAQIQVYPEYTGTITQEILKTDRQLSIKDIRDALQKSGVGMTESLGLTTLRARHAPGQSRANRRSIH